LTGYKDMNINLPIRELLYVDTMSRKALDALSVNTIGELLSIDIDRINKIPGIGNVTLWRLKGLQREAERLINKNKPTRQPKGNKPTKSLTTAPNYAKNVLPVRELYAGPRSRMAMKALSINTIDELLSITLNEINDIPGVEDLAFWCLKKLKHEAKQLINKKYRVILRLEKNDSHQKKTAIKNKTNRYKAKKTILASGEAKDADLPITELHVDTRSRKVLNVLNVTTIAELRSIDLDGIAKMPGVGNLTLWRLKRLRQEARKLLPGEKTIRLKMLKQSARKFTEGENNNSPRLQTVDALKNRAIEHKVKQLGLTSALGERVAFAASAAGFPVVDIARLAAVPAKTAEIPEALDDRIRRELLRTYPHGLYKHQAKAINTFLNCEDICVGTSTASGKTLIFMTCASDLILRNRNKKVLVLYPARALVQDQLPKWEKFLKKVGMSVSYIHGGIPVREREDRLNSEVIMMTPDVAHAWLLNRCQEPALASLLNDIGLVILDEAHVYDGVFGTNMAYMLRRLQARAGKFQIIMTTATMGHAEKFLHELTGRSIVYIGQDQDGSNQAERTILLARPVLSDKFDAITRLLTNLTECSKGPFLAFVDSRKMVEHLVAGVSRSLKKATSNDKPKEITEDVNVLPYRGGYEEHDRITIQRALEGGKLKGVVSTSALELGLDIGEIDLVIMLGIPSSVKAFWQRLGRGSRLSPGVGLVVDIKQHLKHETGSLDKYVKRPIEKNRLYLENRYIQYANALCAADEMGDFPVDPEHLKSFESLSERFVFHIQNELEPKEGLPPDLYALKQRAQIAPHYAFPLRSDMEKEFKIVEKYGGGGRLGTATFPQVIREAYPGAVYYYMGRPYRVSKLDYTRGEAHARREKHFTTKPIIQAMVFPEFAGRILSLWRSPKGFMAEVNLQVRERVTGFVVIN